MLRLRIKRGSQWVQDPVAQLVEHLTFNQRVAGSSPAGITVLLEREREGRGEGAGNTEMYVWRAEQPYYKDIPVPRKSVGHFKGHDPSPPSPHRSFR